MHHLLRRWLLLIVFLFGSGYIVYLMIIWHNEEGEIMPVFHKRWHIQKLLGTTLPERVANLHYFKWQPSSDLSYYTAYIKFSTSRKEFVDLMTRMQMSFHNTGGDANLYLPAAWGTVPELKLDWWDPSPDMPVSSAARDFGINGWIVAKYERDCVYLIVSDTGHVDGTPGPW